MVLAAPANDKLWLGALDRALQDQEEQEGPGHCHSASGASSSSAGSIL